MKTTFLKKALIGAALCVAASSSYADLIYVDNVGIGGTGLGTVNTILTIQGRPTENGGVGVAYNGSGDFIYSENSLTSAPDVKTGQSQTQTRSLSQLNISNASDLVIVFNAAEPDQGSITLDQLVLNIYDTSGSVLFTSQLNASKTFLSTESGTGNSGFSFILNPATLLSASDIAAFSNGANRVGIFAKASDSAGGQETFFVASIANGGGQTEIPEPTTVALLGLGLLGVAASRRKFANAKKA